jgi:hypothetical protein
MSAQLLFSSSGAFPERGAQKRPDFRRAIAASTVGRLIDYAVDDSSLRMIRVSLGLIRERARQQPVRAPRKFTISSLRAFAQVLFCWNGGGAEGIRTPDLRRAKAALSQLSYGPRRGALGWASLESNQGPQSYQDCALAD